MKLRKGSVKRAIIIRKGSVKRAIITCILTTIAFCGITYAITYFFS